MQTIGIMANVNEIRGCVYNYLPPGIKGLPQNMSNASIFSNESKSKTFKKKSKTIQEERIATKHEQCVNNSFGLVFCKLTQKPPATEFHMISTHIIQGDFSLGLPLNS